MVVSRRSYFLERGELAVGECVVRYCHADFGPGWLYFASPARIVSIALITGVTAVLADVESATRSGAYAVGFLSYESASAFDPSLPPPSGDELPIAWFALYDNPPEFARELEPIYGQAQTRLSGEWDFEQYRKRFEEVKAALGRGDAYQVNLTSRLSVETSDSMFGLFRRVCGTQPPPYAAYIQGGSWEISSFSPELFLEQISNRVTMSPMKGTRKAGGDNLAGMDSDPKSMAENLMIVDMVRNDLGRIAEVGSVQTTRLFELESHRTVQQMTSRVEAKTAVGLSELMTAVFPPASVTGAPKVAACHLIRKLETSAREIYCGAIGLVEPSGDARFSVAIRTAWRSGGRVRYGVGSGLVWDSNPRDEFEECLLKAEVIARPAPQWELVECFHRDALGDGSLLEGHWLRVSRSAEQLGIPLERDSFEALILPLRSQAADLPNKIRVAIQRDGQLSVSVSESAVSGAVLRAAIAKTAVSSLDPNLAHKTNSRQVFEHALAGRAGYDEVLLVNERGQVAEFCRGNVVFRFCDQLVTPSPESGCLRGIGAQRLVAQGRAKYSVVTLAEAHRADEIFLINSIRGLIPAKINFEPD